MHRHRLAAAVAFLSLAACDSAIEETVDAGRRGGARIDPTDSNSGDGGTPDAVANQDAAPSDASTSDARTTLDCNTLDRCLEWPFAGTDGHEWVINNYVDLDPNSGGMRDYTGATGTEAKTYDGHRGIDIDVPTFRAMDQNVPVLATIRGRVEATEDRFFDRNTACISQDWNVVTVRHASGALLIYGHLKMGSVVVTVGQTVNAGDPLGIVGSSGCSTGPHLHFEVHDVSGAVIDPFLAGYFRSPPQYQTELSLMDVVFKAGAINNIEEVKDPGDNISALSAGTHLGVGLSLAGGHAGDIIKIRYRDPTGAMLSDAEIAPTSQLRHSYWYWNRSLPAVSGNWTVSVLLNDRTVRSDLLRMQ